MDYKVLYRKYRPENFDDLVGQEYIKKILINSITNNRISHAYIFAGPRGTGKTSTAKIFAKAINCTQPKKGNPCGKCLCCQTFANSPDIIEIDAASNNGVDEIRQLIENVKIANSELKYKVYIIDEVQMMTNNAFNALLLTLEEPPANVIFIFATTDIQSVPSTILSRCQIFSFKPISEGAIALRIKEICQKEGIEIEEQAVIDVASLAAGGLRDALGYIDQLAMLSKKITSEDVNINYGGVSDKNVSNIIEAIEGNRIDELISEIELIKSSGTDYDVFIKKMIVALKLKAIEIKYKKVQQRNLDFKDCLELSLKLIDCINKNQINIDVFSLIELSILNYCKPSEITAANNQIQVIADNVEVTNNDDTAKKIEPSKNTYNFEKIKQTRINNCFVEATKESKLQAIATWGKFITHIKKSDKKTHGILFDTEIVVASPKYYILTSDIESATQLANGSLKSIEQMFANISECNVKIIILNPNEWKQAAEDYKKNKSNNIEYKTIVEEEIETTDQPNGDLGILDEIFDNKKIEMI